MGAPCGICRGRFGRIHYEEPSKPQYPLSFVIDEIIPISKYAEYGYKSRRDAAEDWNNLQAAHYCCNAAKSNKINFKIGEPKQAEPPGWEKPKINISDGEW